MSHDLDPAVLRLEAAAAAGCEESRAAISRRAVMGLTAGFFSWAFMPRFAEAGTATDPRLLVVVLRGGMDGVNTVVPYGDPRYAALRSSLAIATKDLLVVDSLFGFNSSLAKFNASYGRGEAAVVHATCPPLRTRSHFDCQDNLENGLPGDKVANARTGWLNRLMTALPAGHSVKAGGAIQIGSAPLILFGPAPVLGWSTSSFGRPDKVVDNMLMNIYSQTDKALYRHFRRGLIANDSASGVSAGGTSTTLTALQRTFRGAGRLMKAANGPRVAVMSVGGFDTHVNQSTALSSQLKSLDDALDDFRLEMGDEWAKTAVVCATEFGRTAAINGTSGTDHGVGTVALLAGGAINGKKVYGEWPGLAEANLQDKRDLRATTDLRAVFKGVLADHLGIGRATLDDVIFPGSANVAPMANLIRSPTTTASAEPAAARREPAIAAYRRTHPTSFV